MMANQHPPQQPIKIPDVPFESEGVFSEEARRVYKQERKDSGSLPDQPAGNPVGDDKPFKKLK